MIVQFAIAAVVGALVGIFAGDQVLLGLSSSLPPHLYMVFKGFAGGALAVVALALIRSW
jgi:hypothetical protein